MTFKRILLSACALVMSVGLAVTDAEAKRLGSGKSIGMQRDSVTQTAPATPPRTAQAPAATTTPAAAQPPRKNSWLGPVAGLAAGLGLAALASHLGFGEEFGNIMLIALLAFAAIAIFRLLARKRTSEPAMQYAGAGGHGGSVPVTESPTTPVMGGASAPAARALPADFDAEGFVRQAKLNFIRLQAANDAGNVDDLREFVTPEVFAELQMQLSERGSAAQRTEVLEINGDVLECVEENRRYVASVRFRGLIREEAGAAPVDFDEIWHLTKSIDGKQGWVVAGIQQIA